MSEILARLVWRNDHLRKPNDKQVVPASILARKIYELKAEDKATFFILLWRRQRHRRSYVCCWFGSFNAQCWARETWAQTQWMLWEGPKTPWATYRDREVQINEEAQVFVHDLDLFVTVQFLDETPAILSLYQLCSKRGYSCKWKTAKLHDWPKMGSQLLV